MRKRVQAQRKFASTAFIPTIPQLNTPDRQSVREEPPKIVYNKMSAKSLLDIVSQKNLHPHLQPVVVLERLDSNIKNIKPSDNIPLKTPSKLKAALKNKKRRFSLIKMILRPKKRNAETIIKRSKTIRRRVLTIKDRQARSNPNNLRNQKPKITMKRNIASSPEFGIDDERPLKYYAAESAKDNVAKQNEIDEKPLFYFSSEAPEERQISSENKIQERLSQYFAEKSAQDEQIKTQDIIQDNNDNQILPDAILDIPASHAQDVAAGKTSSIHQFYDEDEIERWMIKSEQGEPQLSNSELLDIETPSFKLPLPSGNKNKNPFQPTNTKDIQIREQSASPCPSEQIMTLQQFMQAPQSARDKKCSKCEQCQNITRCEQKTACLESRDRNVQVYDFDEDADDEIDTDSISEFRRRNSTSRSQQPDIPVDESDQNYEIFYLDLMSHTDSKNAIKVYARKMPYEGEWIAKVNLVPKSTVKVNQRELSLADYEKIINLLLKKNDKNRQRSNRMGLSPNNNASQPSTSRNDSNRTNLSTNLIPKNINTRGNLANKKFPKNTKSPSAVVDAPVFYPTNKEFSDMFSYFEKIMPAASKFGICKIVAPEGFNPSCNISDDINFNVVNQYIPRMFTRWGSAARDMCCIKAYLNTQKVLFGKAPVVEGMEVSLPKLKTVVQANGGLNTVTEKKRWGRVADQLRFPKGMPQRKLDQVYVRYLLPYVTLSKEEQHQITSKVEKKWNQKHQKMLNHAQNPLHRQMKLLGDSESSEDESDKECEVAKALSEVEDCVVGGRRMNLSTFKKVATNVMYTQIAQQSPSVDDIEKAYWKLVMMCTDHVCVNSASIDTGEEGYGFTKNKNDPYYKHPWNLKINDICAKAFRRLGFVLRTLCTLRTRNNALVGSLMECNSVIWAPHEAKYNIMLEKMLSQNSNNILRSLGQEIGVTVPTLHLGMVFSTSCWHRDPHGLPWIEYMHSGPGKIWYGIPDEESEIFKHAVEKLCPTFCLNKSIWLPSDITMLPPEMLIEHRVSLSRLVQNPREFIIVFPRAYSCSISTGFTLSESVYFATNSWLTTVNQVFQELRESCEPTTFSLEQLLIATAQDSKVSLSVLQQIHNVLNTIVTDELGNRQELESRGIQITPRKHNKKKPVSWNVREQDECDFCRMSLYLSKVIGLTGKKSALCLNHALRLLDAPKYKTSVISELSLITSFTNSELEDLLKAVEKRLLG